MATDKQGGTGSTVPVQVSVKLQQPATGEKPPKAAAYAFTQSGRLVATAALDDQGRGTLKIPATQSPQDVRVVVGPESQEREMTFADLTRRGAQSQRVRVSLEAKELQATFHIPPEVWFCWFRFCFVKGTLLKRVLSSGIAIDYPVCNADVQIWDVEPIFLILSKLTNIHLQELSRYLLNPQPLPPGPNPPDPGPSELTRLGQIEFAKPLANIQQFSAKSPEFEVLHSAARTGNLGALRQALTTVNEAAVRFLICWLFPRFVTKSLLTTTKTDHCGNFETFVILGCHELVNLYFTVSVNFGWFSVPIYDPTPISCYTYWNYQCGTEVTLFTSSIFAPLCAPCPPVDAPENYVLFRALGNVQLNGIYGTSTVLAGSTTAANTGQAANLYGTGLDSPFGGSVLPRIEFDSSLRASNRAMYYQVSYRQGTSGSFTVLAGSIDRKYNHFVGSDLVTSVYNLGPKVVNGVINLFEIPPAVPPQGDWAFPNPPVDLANAQFPSTDLPSVVVGGTHGKYQLKLDLFDQNGAPVNIGAAGIGYFVPTTVDPDGTIHTADASTLGLVSGNSFIMTVHVDNRATAGSLGDPALDGSPADVCGVFRYGSGHSGTVTIPYSATHPDNFATYSYRLSRGATLLTPPTTSGQVGAATNPAIVSMSVLSLLTQPDGTICDIAGFAEDLYVWALATDGWNRLSGYDSNPPPRAFVLAPPSSTP